MNSEFLKIWFKTFLRFGLGLGFIFIFSILMSNEFYFAGVIFGLLGVSALFAWIEFDAKRWMEN